MPMFLSSMRRLTQLCISMESPLFLVEKGFKGFHTSPKLNKMGMRGSNTCELVFEDCEVPEENVMVVLEKDKVYAPFTDDWTRSRTIGTFRRSARTYASAALTSPFQMLLIEKAHSALQLHVQLMQGKMADMYTTLNACRAYLYAVAKAADNGHVSSKDCAGVILYLAEKCTQVCLDAVQ
ncbi:isovaleryl-CoA dehydrogenase, domain protein, partial [Cooperia oncophora]